MSLELADTAKAPDFGTDSAASGTRRKSTAYGSDEESRAFFQTRVGWFGLAAAGLCGSFLVYRIFADGWNHGLGYALESHFLFHLLATVTFFALWGYTRFGPHSMRALRGAEAIALLVASTAMCGMGLEIPIVVRPDMIMLLALAVATFARAAYVPSSGRRTIALGAATAVPLVAVTYYVFTNPAAVDVVLSDPRMTSVDARMLPVGLAVNTLAWWTLLVAVSALTSKTIYGLRREVRTIQHLGQYQLLEQLGAGGMGVVFRARHALLERPTAVKLLPPDRVGERAIARFEREVQLTAKLRHPSTITIYDYGHTAQGVFYYAMELIDGATLAEIVDVAGPQPPDRVVSILTQAASALVEAHGAGLIHRDLKPQNLMVHLPHGYGEVGEVTKVLDFGLVQEIENPTVSAETALRGTPMYLAPEVVSDPKAVDARSDLYALGAVGYYLLTGEHVFDGKSVLDILRKHVTETPEPPSKRLGASVPEPLERLLLNCLAKEPGDRPQTATDMVALLRGCADAIKPWSTTDAHQWWAEHRGPIETWRRRDVDSKAGATTLLKAV